MSLVQLVGQGTDHFSAMTPGGLGEIGGARFVVGQHVDNADWLVVFGDAKGITTNLPAARRILVVTEPPGIKTYRPGFLDQFGAVLTPCDTPGISGVRVVSHPCINWFYGVRRHEAGMQLVHSYDELLRSRPGPKTAQLSAVISGRRKLPMHRRRLKFAHRLKQRLGDRFQIFGTGFQPISDKGGAIDPFRYHLAIENTVEGHYWTEKLADPLLGWSLPVYCGAPAAGEYFPEGAFVRIDLRDLDAAADEVIELLDRDPYDQHLDAIAEARRRVLEQYSLPATIAALIPRLTQELRGQCVFPGTTTSIAPNELARKRGPLGRWRKHMSKRLRELWKRRRFA